MAIQGQHRLGPDNARLLVRTARSGAAARAGHDLLIEVGSWGAELDLGEDPAEGSVSLDADGSSLVVLEGTGGMTSLGDDDRSSIAKTIDEEVLRRARIEFRSSAIEARSDDRVTVWGELTLLGRASPVSFDLAVGADGGLQASARIRQSDFGIKPYSTLFGALKVADEVEVSLEGPTL